MLPLASWASSGVHGYSMRGTIASYHITVNDRAAQLGIGDVLGAFNGGNSTLMVHNWYDGEPLVIK